MIPAVSDPIALTSKLLSCCRTSSGSDKFMLLSSREWLLVQRSRRYKAAEFSDERTHCV